MVTGKSKDNFAKSATADLARRLGIELEYINAAGKRIVTAPEVIIAVLAAMGYPVETEQAARDFVKVLNDAENSRRLPPVLVVFQDRQPVHIGVNVHKGESRLPWRVILEDGGVAQEGTVGRDNLAVGESIDDAAQRSIVDLSIELPCGYHWFEIGNERMLLIITPARCWLGPIEPGRRVWGVAAQLYQLRSDRNWGIGDFTDLRDLLDIAAGWGASMVGLNPLHALFLDEPEQASPYAPVSRLFLNVLYIDVVAIPEFETCEPALALVGSQAFQSALEAVRAAELVDYGAVAELKLQVLRLIHPHFKTGAAIARGRSFEAFVHSAGEALKRFCTFQAIRIEMRRQTSHRHERSWPDGLRDPGSQATARFVANHHEEIEFLMWAQWVADTQLRDAAYHAQARGMTIGLYRDLAVGCGAAGAEPWSEPDVVVAKAHAGVPPDILNPAGQDWGLPPFNPRRLRETAYAAFINLVRANMRYSGGLRIDHVVGLQHLYWIPEGNSPARGAYVRYPFDDLTGILALESSRNHCLVVGEDLGTVPAGFRDRIIERGILSYRVLYFEQNTDSGEFIAPDQYPALALATIGSHDLATLKGWWLVNDIEMHERHKLYPDPTEGRRQRDTRKKEKVLLLAALRREGLDPVNGDHFQRLSKSLHAFLARTRAAIAMVQLVDLTAELSQVNLPATTDEHPNWRRRLSMTLEEIKVSPEVAAVIEVVRRERSSSKD